MKYTKLGRTNLKVSRICLGAMNFGPHTTEPDSYLIMDQAHDKGINFFDTANVYGGRGKTEEIIGRWFGQGGPRREKTVLATKVYGKMGEWPNESGISALNVKRACEASLKRLKTDYIDLYQMHHIDRDCPWDEVWQAMEQLVREGKVLYIGSSNFAGWHIAQACETAKARGFLGLVSEQSLYNLRARTVELEVLPACKAYGVGVIPWSPLAGGLLGGVLRDVGSGRRSGEKMKENIGKLRPALEQYEGFAKDLGVEPAALALAWLLHQPAVTAPIVGPRTLAQMDAAYAALDISLDDEALKKLDRIWPGPGGEAPEAYAW